ncbi:General stress protein 26 [Prauserella aidingensis]|uniref:pyridoxamine 5'-phosphate oxidase family protein n=1 Tax=Prauserella aidingensis TaxID=387890 RepID=UPI0020A5F028|nr:pyridoxamine 5'-phosphate oxidase family protein [Prauserella aidingensis]MCP2254059.1 General stress protein 26 [Prauserella aidingensis]
MSMDTASPASSLTADDLAFLRRPLQGFFTVAAGPLPPQPRPLWFEAADDGTIQLFTDPDAPKVRRLRQDPRASIVVASPVGEPEHWVSVAGPVTLASEGAHALLERLAARYWDLDDPARAAQLAEMRTADWLRIAVHPASVRRVAG